MHIVVPRRLLNFVWQIVPCMDADVQPPRATKVSFTNSQFPLIYTTTYITVSQKKQAMMQN